MASSKSNKWTTGQIPPQTGKTALITGANSGIGYQAALVLARHGAHVLLGVRSRAKGEAALARLQEEVPGASAEVAELNMASLASIRRFVEGFARPLDVLVNNAGAMALPKRELTEDGFERQFGTNHMGHFALTGLLMPRLLQSSSPRVVTVSSLAHRNGKMDFDDLQGAKKYSPWTAYNQSKLANLLFALELDRRARSAGSRLRSIPVHPGIARTRIVVNGPGVSGPKMVVLKLLTPFITQDDAAGALPTLYAATAPEARGGVYIGPDGFKAFKGSPTVERPRPQALDEAVAKRLWSVSEELTGVVYPALG
ncbi:MAG: oxidoreductase [Acidobacteriota bacterium]|nr:oxidoreductase [Acidobacteriota bacterium]